VFVFMLGEKGREEVEQQKINSLFLPVEILILSWLTVFLHEQ